MSVQCSASICRLSGGVLSTVRRRLCGVLADFEQFVSHSLSGLSGRYGEEVERGVMRDIGGERVAMLSNRPLTAHNTAQSQRPTEAHERAVQWNECMTGRSERVIVLPVCSVELG